MFPNYGYSETCTSGSLTPGVFGIRGFPLNLSLVGFPALGDFVPPGSTVGTSSAALFDRASEATPTAIAGISRPTLDGKVDLVTGAQLAQVNDLSLPVSGGEFRLIRTRTADRMGLEAMGDYSTRPHRWWDWSGDGWMSSENPILLIDSAVPDIVGSNARTTYLVLDVFHTIPFQFIESNGTYESPPRFRARLTHNGQGYNAEGRSWTQPPTRFSIDLYEGEVTYVFHAVGTIRNGTFQPDDIPPKVWYPADWLRSLQPQPAFVRMVDANTAIGSFHDRPLLKPSNNSFPFVASDQPGLGLPYYALCTEIVTKSGIKAKMTYCGMSQFGHRPSTQTGWCQPLTVECTRCLQTCPSKGQLSKVDIYARNNEGQELLEWTLLYHYRIAPVAGMRGVESCYTYAENAVLYDQYSQAYGRRVLNRIYAFKTSNEAIRNAVATVGDSFCVPARYDYDHDCDGLADSGSCLDNAPEPLVSAHAVRTNENLSGQTFSPVALNVWNVDAFQSRGLNQLWSARIDYSYALHPRLSSEVDPDSGQYVISPIPVLVKTTTLQKEMLARPEEASGRRRVFTYAGSRPPYWNGTEGDITSNYSHSCLLTGIFDDSDIARAVAALNTGPTQNRIVGTGFSRAGKEGA